MSLHKRVWAQTCLGTIVCGHNRVWAQSCAGTIVCGHKRVWAQWCVGTIVCEHKRVWSQTCVGTNVCGHKRVWAQSCVGTIVSGHKRVWAQSCMGTNVVEPYSIYSNHNNALIKMLANDQIHCICIDTKESIFVSIFSSQATRRKFYCVGFLGRGECQILLL